MKESPLDWRPAAGAAVPRRPLWELVERLGEGGGGEAWLARHETGERRVFKFCFAAEQLRALKREVTFFRLLRETLGHRRDIARILDWQFEEPPFFVESEFTAGGCLPDWAGRGAGLAAVPLATRVALVAEVAEALGAAHAVGILHKDVKPENILIAEDRAGRPRALLADFGIGLLMEPGRLAAAGITALGFTETFDKAGAGAGTLGYRAPELAAGRPASIQADLYALGVVLYQLVVGDFHRPLAPGWQRDVADPLLAEDLARLVDGDPERRPASAREVAAQLRRLEERRAERLAEADRQRALARAERRRRRAGAAAALGLAVLAVVALMGLREYRARRAAEAAEARAGRRQGQAEELIGFMLGDLRRKLDGVGRLDVLDAVGEQAMAYFAAVPASELTDNELARRAKALYQIGEVRTRQGRLPAAKVAFDESVRLAESLTARAPQRDEAWFELAQGRFWLGNVDWNQRRPQAAREQFDAYLAIAEQRAVADPAATQWQLEVAYALTSLAAVRQSQGEMAAAERELRRSIAIKQTLTGLEPGNREWRTSLANGLAWLGSMMGRLGRLSDSLLAFEAERELRQKLLDEDPRDSFARATSSACLGNLGQAQTDRGDLAAAAASFGREVELLEELVRGEPAERRWQRDLAVAYLHLAELKSFGGDTAGRRLAARADTLLSGLAALDSSNAEWREELAHIRLRRAEIELRFGMAPVALRLARQALGALPANSEAIPVRLWRAKAYLILGRVLTASSKTGQAMAAWKMAESGLASLASGQPSAEIRHAWAELLLRTGRKAEAESILASLREIGYRRPDFEATCIENGI